MDNTLSSDPYRFWKRPWQKWVVLAAGIAQLLTLRMTVREYRTIRRLGILSSSAWLDYRADAHMQCALQALSAILFLGGFLIGVLAKSKQGAMLSERIFLICLTLFWGILGVLLQLPTLHSTRLLWSLILLLLAVSSIYSLLKSRRCRRS